MIINTVKTAGKTKKVPVSSLAAGTLVYWESAFNWDGVSRRLVFVVLAYWNNPSKSVGAVGLQDGGYLAPDTLVEPLEPGTEFTVVVGG